MTAEEKAQELLHKFRSVGINHDWDEAKQEALIAVDMLIKEHTWKEPIRWNVQRLDYWSNIRKEIEKL